MRNIIGITAFFLLSTLPGLDMFFELAPSRLGGVESAVNREPLSAAAVWSEKWQQSFEKWWGRALGFRGFFIRSDNQLCLSLFNELGSQNRKRVISGRDSYLFEKAYVTAYQNSIAPPNYPAVKALVSKIKQSEELLRAKGVAFVLLISPSKAVVLSDKLPAKYQFSLEQQAEVEPLREYKAFTAELDAQQVSYLDARSWLLEHKEQLKAPIFYKSGAHWSQDSGCRVVARVFSLLETQLGQHLRRIDCDQVKIRSRPRGQDGDLLRLANIWFGADYAESYVYPAGVSDKSGNKFVPKLIVIGSSFMWDPLDIIQKARLATRSSRLYYYFRSRAISPNRRLGTIDPAGSDWRDEIFKSHAVIVEINESALSNAGFGFFDALTGSLVPAAAAAAAADAEAAAVEPGQIESAASEQVQSEPKRSVADEIDPAEGQVESLPAEQAP